MTATYFRKSDILIENGIEFHLEEHLILYMGKNLNN